MRNMCNRVFNSISNTIASLCIMFLMKQGVAIMSPIATVESVSILLYITMEIGNEWIVTVVVLYSKMTWCMVVGAFSVGMYVCTCNRA